MATTKITNPDLFELESLNTALRLPSGSTEQRPANPSTGEWRYNTTTNVVEYYDGGSWRELVSENIPPIINENFNVVLYTGNGSTQSITGVGFKPDFVWIKPRNFVDNHALSDSSRGVDKSLASNTTATEQSLGVTSFDADGFSLPNWGNVNSNGDTFVAWCWKANGGTTSSNTDGTITSTVQVNSKAGFSIVQWTGTGSAGTLGHGLSSAPEMIIVKDTTVAYNWYVYTTATGSNIRFEGLNNDSASSSAPSQMTSTATLIENVPALSSLNTSGSNMLIYAFHSVGGYSKIGSYTGNGSDNGPIINTGFQPQFVMIKSSSTSGNWVLFDDKRSPSNPRNNLLWANKSDAEQTFVGTREVNFYSNGFQPVSSGSDDLNDNGQTYIYMAFASDPSAAPVLADSFANKLYTGNGGTQSITGLGFSPSWVWIKSRSNTYGHRLIDTVTGPDRYIASNSTDAQQGAGGAGLISFDSDGFSVGSGNAHNANGSSFVAWNWKSNPIPSINTDGTIQSVVSANQAAGFSIVSYTGNSTAGSTVGHGLTSAPEAVIIKCLNTGSTNWINYYESIGNSDYLTLNLTNSVDTFTNWFYSNATTFTLNQTFGNANTSGRTYLAYCFKSTSGFSKIGSYTGNGGSNSITGLGFQPSFIMIKSQNISGSWFMYDSDRTVSVGDNPGTANARPYILANTDGKENGSTSYNIDLDSDGFSMNTSVSDLNSNTQTYIYMAFKENPTPVVPAGYMAFLTVAGGGAGGRDSNSGGGGAGGLRTSFGSTSGGGASSESDITLAAGTYTITVGAGGPDNSNSFANGDNGSDSSIAASGLSTITSLGGGGGAGQSGTPNGSSGGSGGGGSYSSSGGAGTANQGYAGGAGQASGSYPGGGGGGASEAGSTNALGHGGDGLAVSITGSPVTYAGGGGAGRDGGSGSPYPGGAGGGGNGTACSTSNTAGTANTGGGGGGYAGGGCASVGKAGGSGVVILRLRTTDYSGTTTGSPTVTTLGDETILTYTGSGTYVHA